PSGSHRDAAAHGRRSADAHRRADAARQAQGPPGRVRGAWPGLALAGARRGGRRRAAVFGPGVFGVAALELAADARVVTLPKPGEVASHLDRALIGRQEVQRERHPTATDARAVREPEEVLQARLDVR